MTTIDAALEAVRSLSPGDRRMIAETILDELEVTDPEPLSESDREFIEQRLAAYRSNPQNVRPYDEVVARVKAKYGK